MEELVTISVKIPKSLKDEVEKLKIDISEVFVEALEEEIKRKKLEEIKKRRNKLREALSRIPNERIVGEIRRMREER